MASSDTSTRSEDRQNTTNGRVGRDIWEIPSIYVPSLRVVIDAFGNSIERIEGDTRQVNTNPETLHELGGFSKEDIDGECYTMDYEAEYGGIRHDSPHKTNGLGGQIGEEILEEMDKELGVVTDDNGREFPADIQVRKLVIEFESDRIQWQAGTETNEFRATYVSQPAEEERSYKQTTRELFRERGLIEQKFQYRNLNLQSFAEVGSTTPIIKWTGRHDISPNKDNNVATLIERLNHPDSYSELKKYTVGEKQEAVPI